MLGYTSAETPGNGAPLSSSCRATCWDVSDSSCKARVDYVVRQTARIGNSKAPPGLLGRVTRDLVLPLFLKQGVAMLAPIVNHHIAWDERVTASA